MADILEQCQTYCGGGKCMSGDTCAPMMHGEPCYGEIADEFLRLRAELSKKDARLHEDGWLAPDEAKELQDKLMVAEGSYELLAEEAPRLRAEVAEKDAEIERLSLALERDRSTVADGINAVMKAVKSREWLRLGRGSYEWDDDRWKDEFGEALNEIEDALGPLRKVAGDWDGCPADPDKIKKARAADAENERLREALGWYGEQARLCRLIHSEGDAGRKALSDDGGERARAALTEKDDRDGYEARYKT